MPVNNIGVSGQTFSAIEVAFRSRPAVSENASYSLLFRAWVF